MPAAIVDGQTLAFDGISGATFTGNAILEAVAACVESAGGDVDALWGAPTAPSSTELAAGVYQKTAHGHHSDVEVRVTLGEHAIEAVRGFGARVRAAAWPTDDAGELDCDVLVVGSGMAGIAAALSAQEAGAQVVLAEKLPYWGGVSQTCKGYFRLPFDGSDQSAENYYQYGLHMVCGPMKGETVDDQYPDRGLLHMLAYNNYDALRWLESSGAQLELLPIATIQNMPQYFLGGCHFVSDDGTGAPDVTGMSFERLLDGFAQRGGRILLESPVESLTVEDGRVTGATIAGTQGRVRVRAGAVVLAAGGYGNNPALVERWAPAYRGERNVTLVGNRGDGILMGLDAGGTLWDNGLMMGQFGQSMMTDYDMVYPYEDDETPSSAVFVNPQGLRVNSETPVAYSGGSSYVDPDPAHRDFYWAVVNAGILADESDCQAMLDEQLAVGNPRFVTAPTLAELARACSITPNTLRYTLNRYNAWYDAGVDEDFAKDPAHLRRFEDEGPWYAVKCPLTYFGTVGGLKTDVNCQVLDGEGRPVEGLYAAGENANGGFFNSRTWAAARCPSAARRDGWPGRLRQAGRWR